MTVFLKKVSHFVDTAPMKYLIFFFFIVAFLFQSKTFANSQAYSLCPNVQSYYYSDPLRNRSIVMNYDPVRKHFVFLRCGESDTARLTYRTSQLKCHIYREGHEGVICRDEITHSRVSRVISDVVDTGVSAAISGGLSPLSVVRRVIGTAQQLRITPQCLGTSMMKAMVLGANSAAITNTFYEAATEIGPMTGITRFTTHNPTARSSYIFSQLDYILSPSNRTTDSESRERRVSLTGPSYMTVEKNSQGVDRLVLDTAEHRSLCTYMANIGNPTGTTPEEEPNQTRAVSSQKDGLIDLSK